MLVSSVYSWLKELRANYEEIDEKVASRKPPLRACAAQRPNSISTCMRCSLVTPSTTEGEDLILPRRYSSRQQRRSVVKSATYTERKQKAFSVGDAWGLDFQVSQPTTDVDLVAECKKEVRATNPEKPQEAEEEEEEVITQEFSFLEEEDKIESLYNHVNITTSLSSMASFVSLPTSSSSSSENSSLEEFSVTTTSGTYTLDHSLESITFPYQRFRTDSMDEMHATEVEEEQPQDGDAWLHSPRWQATTFNAQLPTLKKVRSLDALDHLEPEVVQLRPKPTGSSGHNRRSVIPLLNIATARQAIILPKTTAAVGDIYMNLWECFAPPSGRKPAPAPRTKLLCIPPTPPVVTPRRRVQVELKQARENVVSFAFDETVEILTNDNTGSVHVDDRTKCLPPVDVVLWMSRLMTVCESEDESEMEIPPSYDTQFGKQHNGGESPAADRKPSKTYKSDDSGGGGGGGVPTNGRKLSRTKSTEEQRDNKIDFNNIKKYKIDNQTVKLTKNDVIHEHQGRLVHKNHDGEKILIEQMKNCRVEERSAKEQVLIASDNRKIHFYRQNNKQRGDGNNGGNTNASNSSLPTAGESKMEHMKSRLVNFLKIRPFVNVLMERGIYQNETVFGNTLSALEEKHRTSVPALVRACIDYVELPHNIIAEGLYRASASLATLQDLRFAINKNENNYRELLAPYKHAADVPSGLLKLFIRELKESLIRVEDFEKLSEIAGGQDSTDGKYRRALHVVDKMASAHRDTLEALLRHLVVVAGYERQNAMGLCNLAVCWGQTMCPEQNEPLALLKEKHDVLMAKEKHAANEKNVVVELLLHAYQALRMPVAPSAGGRQSPLDDRIAAHEERVRRQVSFEERDSYAAHHWQQVKQYINVLPKSNLLSMSSKSMDMINTMQREHHVTGSVGSNLSVRSCIADTSYTARLKFMRDLIQRIEAHDSVKGVYKGKGAKSTVRKLLRKSQKAKSKEFDKLLRAASIFTLGDCVKEIVKEYPCPIAFDDMQTLVRGEDGARITRIIDDLPEMVTRVFRHLAALRAKFDSDAEQLTLLVDLCESWWPLLIDAPPAPSKMQAKRSQSDMATAQAKRAEMATVAASQRFSIEEFGRNPRTFEALIDVVHEQSVQRERLKSASLFDLSSYGAEGMTSVTEKEEEGYLCCAKSGNRMTSYYTTDVDGRYDTIGKMPSI